MSYCITRTNGIVVQVWEDSAPAWYHFKKGWSRDIRWKNTTAFGVYPMRFKSVDQAKWYLNKRQELLPDSEKEKDKQWNYSIEEESKWVG